MMRRLMLSLVSLALTLGCTDPDSTCDEGQVRCRGELAGVCEGSSSRDPFEPTLYDWFERDCAAEGLRCVVDGPIADCVAEAEPCDPAAFDSRCVDGHALVCQQLVDPGDQRSPRAWPVLDDCPIRGWTCIIGSTGRASCIEPGGVPCDPIDSVTCTPDGVLYCDSNGAGFTSACGDEMGGDACVSTATDAFCVIDDTPCDPTADMPRCDEAGAAVIECVQAADDPRMGYWRLGTCLEGEPCVDGGCVPAE